MNQSKIDNLIEYVDSIDGLVADLELRIQRIEDELTPDMLLISQFSDYIKYRNSKQAEMNLD